MVWMSQMFCRSQAAPFHMVPQTERICLKIYVGVLNCVKVCEKKLRGFGPLANHV
jgi:hypothetical protein